MIRHAITVALLLASSAMAAKQPNVVVVLCDDLGYGDLACYGSPTVQTPHICLLYTSPSPRD